MTRASSGRAFEPELSAIADTAASPVALRSPAVGLWRDAPAPGTLLRPGDSIGHMEILGVLHRIVVPPGARGVVLEDPEHEPLARRPLAHGQRMLVLDATASGAAEAAQAEAEADPARAAEGLVFRAPTSGRFYIRPSPDRPPFVTAGDEIETGRTVCLLEVMKTFNRVTYGGKGLPERARVKAILPRDEDDLAAGDVILLLDVLA